MQERSVTPARNSLRPVDAGNGGARTGDAAATLAAARREFIADIERGHGGRVAQARFADRLDALICGIVDSALAHVGTKPVAVAALGGYGRRALCLYSDIDLLIVFEGAIAGAEERFVKAVLHPLWDLHLTVGHQVRVLADFDELEHDNPEFVLAALDARLVAGDGALFGGVRERLNEPRVGWRRHAADALLTLTGERHARFNGTIYQLEPDVKDSPGGLRDITAARTLAALAVAPRAGFGVDRERLDQAEDFLLRVRSMLHLSAGRNLNVLTHDLQEALADRLQYPGTGGQQRVEALMGAYFRHARLVRRALTLAHKGILPISTDATQTALGANLVLTAEGVGFVDERRAAVEPASWLTAFEAALDRGVPVTDAALGVIELHCRRYTVRHCLPTPDDRLRLRRLLRPRRGLYDRLLDLHDCGLLDRLFPEFQAISGRVIRDFHHKYTVDEHTLLTIRGLERLRTPDQPSRERFSSVFAELSAPENLVLALLFHDVGKWKEGNHAQESLQMAQTMLDRLEVEPEARQDIEFLIAQHLQMSRIAFRRDSEDPVLVRQFAELVGTEERLKMLCLMTLVDMEAVSSETLTSWREDLLWRLYVDTYNELTLGYGDQTIERGQAAVEALQAQRPADLSEQEVTRFLEGFPRRYLQLFVPAEIYRHARLARDIHSDEVHQTLEQKGDVWELTVATRDKPYLFSNICGVLSYFGMDILRGSAMTSPAGLVLDFFQFSDREGFLRLNPDMASELTRLLENVVAGRTDVAKLLARKENGLGHRQGARRIAPVVRFDTEHSQRYTVLEIIAQDAVGLLHRISRVISEHGCDLELVLISTEGNRAVDVFHIVKAGGLLAEADREALKQGLERMLEDGYEAH